MVTEQDRVSRLDEIPWALLKQTFRDSGARFFTLSGEVDFHNEDGEFSADMALIDRRRRKMIVRQMVHGRAGAAAPSGNAHRGSGRGGHGPQPDLLSLMQRARIGATGMESVHWVKATVRSVADVRTEKERWTAP